MRSNAREKEATVGSCDTLGGSWWWRCGGWGGISMMTEEGEKKKWWPCSPGCAKVVTGGKMKGMEGGRDKESRKRSSTCRRREAAGGKKTLPALRRKNEKEDDKCVWGVKKNAHAFASRIKTRAHTSLPTPSFLFLVLLSSSCRFTPQVK